MQILIQFEKQLHFFLSRHHHDSVLNHSLERRASVKDIIESFGVPHTEVGEIRFNDNPVDFYFVPADPGKLNISGISPPFNVCNSSRLRPIPYHTIRFIADANVMKLGSLLILSGFDVCIPQNITDRAIAEIAVAQQRIILTRDTRLLMRKKIVYARRIRENIPYMQLSEVLTFFGLTDQCRMMSRCIHCNIRLEPVKKEKVIHLLEPKTKKYYFSFYQCPDCKQVYWKGSHYDRLKRVFKDLKLSLNH